jgi:hydroxyacylglutathione hydrolase
MGTPETRIHKIRLGLCNAYLILGEEGAVLVDTGQAGWTSLFFNHLKNTGIRPEDVRLIVITHVHFDHVGNLKALTKRCGCPVAIHVKEASLLSHGTVVFPPGTNLFGRIASRLGRGMAPFLKFAPLQPDLLVSSELPLKRYGVPGSIIPTPGHTVGSLSVLLPDGTACVGDLAANYLPGGLGPIVPPFADDVQELFRSWMHLLEAGAKTICPGHGRPFQAKVLRTAMKNYASPNNT